MYLIMLLFSFYLLFSFFLMKMSILISMKFKLNFEKMSPFECGFNPIFFQRMPFSIRFFLITIIFLIFDVEISFIFPMIVIFKNSNLIIWFFTSLNFILILFLGLIHEWKQGILNWI